MNEALILQIILGIVIFDFVLEKILGYFNIKSSRNPIPKELDGIYDEEKYQKSQDYQSAVNRFGNLTSTFSFILMFAFLYYGWFGTIDSWIREYSSNEMLTPLLFFGLIYIVSDLIGIPFSIYSNFVIEEKFGFNKITPKTFIMDKLKGYLLAILIGGLLLSIFIYMVNALGEGFWIYFWIVITIFILVMNMFYTSLILPLFNKLKPLGEGDLKSSIEAFSQKVSFPLSNIFVIDGSKRSSKGNAFFSGLGRKKKVVLYDTLIEKHTVEELTAVFAHEVGHYKHKHIYLSTGLAILQMGIMLYLLSRMIFNPEVSAALGGGVTAIHLNMMAFGILYSPLSHIMGIGMNIISRKNEYEADAYAVENYSGKPLIDGLKRLSGDHLSNLTPHPAYVFVHYSHPTLLQRIIAMKKAGA